MQFPDSQAICGVRRREPASKPTSPFPAGATRRWGTCPLNASQKEDGSQHLKSQISTSSGDTPSMCKHKREDKLKDLIFAKMVEKFTLEA